MIGLTVALLQGQSQRDGGELCKQNEDGGESLHIGEEVVFLRQENFDSERLVNGARSNWLMRKRQRQRYSFF